MSSDKIYNGREHGLVLVIEDNSVAADGTRTLFEEWGYDCMLARDKVTALERCNETGAPDLIVVDYNHECVAKGIDVVEAVRELFGQDIPATLVSANQKHEAYDEARRKSIPIQDKPVNPARLRALASFQIQRKREGGEAL